MPWTNKRKRVQLLLLAVVFIFAGCGSPDSGDKMSSLESDISSLRKEISSLKNEINDLETKNTSLESKLKSVEGDVNSLKIGAR